MIYNQTTTHCSQLVRLQLHNFSLVCWLKCYATCEEDIRIPRRNRKEEGFKQSLAYVSVLLSGRKLATARQAANLVRNVTLESRVVSKPIWQKKLNALVIVRNYNSKYRDKTYEESHGFVVGYDQDHVYILTVGHCPERKRILSVLKKDGQSEAEISAKVIKTINQYEDKDDISLIRIRREFFVNVQTLESLRLVSPQRKLNFKQRRTVYQFIWRTKRTILRSVSYKEKDGAGVGEDGGFWILTGVLDGDSGSPILDQKGDLIGIIVSGTEDETYVLKPYVIRQFLEHFLPECTQSALVPADEIQKPVKKERKKSKSDKNLLTVILAFILFLPGLSKAQTDPNQPSFYSEQTLESILDVVLGYPLIAGGIISTAILGLLLYLGFTNRIGRNVEKTLSEESAEEGEESEDKEQENISPLPLYGKPIPWTKKNKTRLKTIKFSSFLEEQIKISETNRAVAQRYVLVYRDTENQGWIAGGLIEITTRNKQGSIRFTRDPETELHRVPEQFIRCVIGRHNPRQIVFLANLEGFQSAGPLPKSNGRKLMGRIFRKFKVLQPNYNDVPVKEVQLEEAENIFDANNQNYLSFGYEYGKVHLWRQVQYYMASLRFNRIYRRNALFWFLCHYLDEMLHGLFIAMIYITAESMGVLSVYNVILHVAPVFIALFTWPVMARIETNLVQLRRDRRSSEDEGSYWDRKIQNHEAFGKIKQYIRIYGFTYIAILFLFFLMIHPERLEQGWGSSLMVQLTPALFLGVFLVWHVVEETVGQFIGEIMAEIDAGEIYYSDDGVKKGFAFIGDSIGTVEGLFSQLFMISSFMIGYGIYHAELYDIMLPLFFIIGFGGIACWFSYPLFFGEDFNSYLEIEQSVFLPGSQDNSVWLSDNIEIVFTPKDKRLENIEPIHVQEGKALLPWVRDLGVTLRYKEEPRIRTKRRFWFMKYIEIHGIGTDPLISIKQRMGSVSKADGQVKKKKDYYEITLRVRTEQR